MTKKTDAYEWTKHRNRLLLHAGVSSGSALVAGGLTILSVYWSPLLIVGVGAAASFALMGLLEDSRNLKVLLEPPKVCSQRDQLTRLEEDESWKLQQAQLRALGSSRIMPVQELAKISLEQFEEVQIALDNYRELLMRHYEPDGTTFARFWEAVLSAEVGFLHQQKHLLSLLITAEQAHPRTLGEAKSRGVYHALSHWHGLEREPLPNIPLDNNVFSESIREARLLIQNAEELILAITKNRIELSRRGLSEVCRNLNSHIEELKELTKRARLYDLT